MTLSEFEAERMQQIHQWLNELESRQEAPGDLLQRYDLFLDELFALLPDEMQKRILESLDQCFIYVQVALHQVEHVHDKAEKIIANVKVMNSKIDDLSGMKSLPLEKLQLLAEREINMHQLYSLVQGGLAGSGNPLLLGIDLPAVILINLKAIQSIALSYGYPIHHPVEAILALKVFHSATLPKRFQRKAWDRLFQELRDQDGYFYEGNNRISDVPWFNTLLLQLMKAVAIHLFRNKETKKGSFFSVAIGAGSNYVLTKQVTDWAHRFYQYRFLLDKNDYE